MRRLIVPLVTCAAAACAASTPSRAHDGAEPSPPIAVPARTGHAAVDLTGTWTTGSAGEPEAKQIERRPECNYSPAVWIIEQSGDTVRAWQFPERREQGIATKEAVSKAGAEGWVSGADVVMSMSGARYVLHYDSTSGHLRGTLNGAPFWAVPLQIVRPEGCIPVP